MPSFKNTTHDKFIDTSGLICPLPVLKAKQALLTMKSGAVLKIVTTDPTSDLDFPVFAQTTGNKLISKASHNSKFTYYLLVK